MGRPRKLGKRTKTGRLSRAVEQRVPGNDRAELRKIAFGSNGSDAIGRAFERGLLGSGSDAKAMLDTSRAICRTYWQWFENGPFRCTLADRHSGGGKSDDEREAKREKWLLAMLKMAGKGGLPCRALFDQLVIDINPDQGPAWLDRLIARQPDAQDWGRLSTALDALADCAGVQRLTARQYA